MKTFIRSVFAFTALMTLPVIAQDPPAAPVDAPAPQIVCDEPVYDFGERDNTEFVEHDYPIRNAGTASLEIKEVRASCGCTAVKPSQDVIPPGGEASIRARLDLRGRNGLQMKTITVNSNDPKTPTLQLQLKGTAVQALRAEPSSVFFGRVEPSASRTRVFNVISGKGPMQIVSFQTDNPGIQVKALPPEEGTDGSRYRFELALDPALPEGNIVGSIFVKTDLADQPELGIPVAAFIAATPAPVPAPAP